MLIPVDGYHLRSIDLGSGTPILMHDGWVASLDLWLPMIELLQGEWRCVAYDHRGAGASTFPPEAISHTALVDDLFRVLDAHEVDRCVVAGESLGTLVCQEAVLRDPSRFLGLVMIGGFPRGGGAGGDKDRMFHDWPGYVAGFVDACLPEADAQPWRRFGCNTLLPAGPEAAEAMTAAHDGVSPDIASIAVPTLVVHGQLDAIAPIEGARELASSIPDARLVVIDDAGHVPLLTRPREVVSALESWWSTINSRSDSPKGPATPSVSARRL